MERAAQKAKGVGRAVEEGCVASPPKKSGRRAGGTLEELGLKAQSAESFGGRTVLTVSELTKLIKGTLEREPSLKGILVKGEISNFKHHTSGHMYFTLKDANSRIKCVMFRGRNAALRFRPEDGLTVIAGGSLGVYEVAGEYQLYVDELHPAGVGALHLAFEQLKEKLAAEGLFDPQRKRSLPKLPRTVGVVTSPTGAAIRDIVSVLRRRFPTINIILAPAIVQGEAGPPSVIEAIERLNRRDDIDVLIVGRGGGSLEELWVFNDEGVARAIAASRIPVISAVGHETDFTIADFVADRRAPTPSAAAEMAVMERAALVEGVRDLHDRTARAMEKRIREWRDRLGFLTRSAALTRPQDRLNQLRQQLDELSYRMEMTVRHSTQSRRSRLEALVAKLDGLSPLGALARGYAICRIAATDEVVTDASRVRPGERLKVRVRVGELTCQALAAEDEIEQPSLPIG